MARNRHSWEKRSKELARKAKQEEKTKRRQSKSQTSPVEESSEEHQEDESLETGDSGQETSIRGI